MFSENYFSIFKLVTIAKRIHLFPSRTQKLSSFTVKIVKSENSELPIFFVFKALGINSFKGFSIIKILLRSPKNVYVAPT